jgi:hypothetical protein
MAPPIDVAGLRPRLGDVEAPPKSRSSLSSVAEVESEPVAEPPELFQLKCLSHAPGVITHLNRNNLSVPQI